MGQAGSADAEYGSDRSGSYGKLPSGERVGRIYGCCHQGAEQAGSAHCVYPLGQTGTNEGEDAEQPQSSDLKSASPQPFIGI